MRIESFGIRHSGYLPIPFPSSTPPTPFTPRPPWANNREWRRRYLTEWRSLPARGNLPHQRPPTAPAAVSSLASRTKSRVLHQFHALEVPFPIGPDRAGDSLKLGTVLLPAIGFDSQGRLFNFGKDGKPKWKWNHWLTDSWPWASAVRGAAAQERSSGRPISSTFFGDRGRGRNTASELHQPHPSHLGPGPDV